MNYNNDIGWLVPISKTV